jgi:hypothetical protein
MSTLTPEEVNIAGLALAEELPRKHVGSYRGVFFMLDRGSSNFQADVNVCIRKIIFDIRHGHTVGNNDSETLVLFDAGVATQIDIKVSITP